jgi:hypothetical protein
MGILPMSNTGILPVVFPEESRAKMALLRTGKMPVLRVLRDDEHPRDAFLAAFVGAAGGDDV